MSKKVYFAGSIRGGRDDARIYHEIIEHIQKTCTVLTEHVGREDYHVDEQGLLDEAIYHQDMAWLVESDLVTQAKVLPTRKSSQGTSPTPPVGDRLHNY